MINAAPTISSLQSAGSITPTMMPPQGVPPLSTAPTPGSANSASNNDSLAKKFTPKVLIGLIVLLVVVVGSGVALYLNSQVGIGENRQQAAGACNQWDDNQTLCIANDCDWNPAAPSTCTGTTGGSCSGVSGCAQLDNEAECQLNGCTWTPGDCSQYGGGSSTQCTFGHPGCVYHPATPSSCEDPGGEPPPTPPGEACDSSDFTGPFTTCNKNGTGCVQGSAVSPTSGLPLCTWNGQNLSYSRWICGAKNWIPDYTVENGQQKYACSSVCPWEPQPNGACCPTGPDVCNNPGSQCYVPDPYVSTCIQWDYTNQCPAGQKYFWAATDHYPTLETLLEKHPGVPACDWTPSPTPPGGGDGGPACDDICTSDDECKATNVNWMCTNVGAGNISFEAASPWAGPIPLTNSPSAGTWESQAEVVINNGASLYQSVRKGNLGWARIVPIKADGFPDWAASGAWSGPYTHTGLPKPTGPVQALSYTLFQTQPERTMMIALWMGNEGYSKTVPMLSSGALDFTRASDWSGPVAYTTLPCQAGGQIESTADVVIGAVLRQTLWCANQNFVRTVPIQADGNPNWSAASTWSGPTTPEAAGYPGSGEIQTNGLVALDNGYVLQTMWRGNQGWTREAPIGRRCRDSANPGSKMCSATALACLAASVTTSNTPNLLPGQSATFSSTTNVDANNFYYVGFNKDNLYDNGTPKPICVTSGGDVNTITADCPAGSNSYVLVFKNQNTESRTNSGTMTRTYEQIFMTDWKIDPTGNTKADNVQFNAYMSVTGGQWTAPVPACVGYAVASSLPTPTPPVSPSPSPVVSPSPSPVVSPSPAGPMCMSITMSILSQGSAENITPTIGDSVTFTCGLVTGATRYEFRVMQPDGQLVNLAATGQVSSSYTIATAGTYYAQCRFCTGATLTCNQPWEPLPTVTPSPTSVTTSPLPSPTFGTAASPVPSPTLSTASPTPPGINPPPFESTGINN